MRNGHLAERCVRHSSTLAQLHLSILHLTAGIGRRARDEKQYFMINEKDGREVMACLVSSKKAPSALKDETNKRSFLRVLELCKHPCLTPVLRLLALQSDC